jgi:hypothetical protein
MNLATNFLAKNESCQIKASQRRVRSLAKYARTISSHSAATDIPRRQRIRLRAGGEHRTMPATEAALQGQAHLSARSRAVVDTGPCCGPAVNQQGLR